MVRAQVRKAATGGRTLVSTYVARLVAAGCDAARFDPLFDELQEDPRLKVADLVAIAAGYSRSGMRPRSKTLAYSQISKRFVDIVRESRSPSGSSSRVR